MVHKHLENDRMKNDQLFMFIELTFHMNFLKGSLYHGTV
jgi:hypothetical protein